MSQENIEIVRRGFAAWDRQDYEQAASLFSSDVEIDASDLELNPAVYVGIDGARSFRNEMTRCGASSVSRSKTCCRLATK